MQRPVLLLNNTEELLMVVSWKKAINLLFSGKARVPHGFDHFYLINTTAGSFPVSTVIVLNQYVRIPHKYATLSRKNILKRDCYICQYCGVELTSTNKTVDHIVPISKGGKHSWDNLVASCKRCNTKKGSKYLSECGFKLKTVPYKPSVKFLIDQNISSEKRHELGWSKWI